ncbi:dynactin 50 kda subunit, partial [Lasius niger]
TDKTDKTETTTTETDKTDKTETTTTETDKTETITTDKAIDPIKELEHLKESLYKVTGKIVKFDSWNTNFEKNKNDITTLQESLKEILKRVPDQYKEDVVTFKTSLSQFDDKLNSLEDREKQRLEEAKEKWVKDLKEYKEDMVNTINTTIDKFKAELKETKDVEELKIKF